MTDTEILEFFSSLLVGGGFDARHYVVKNEPVIQVRWGDCYDGGKTLQEAMANLMRQIQANRVQRVTNSLLGFNND